MNIYIALNAAAIILLIYEIYNSAVWYYLMPLGFEKDNSLKAIKEKLKWLLFFIVLIVIQFTLK